MADPIDDHTALRWLSSFVRPRLARLAAVLAVALLSSALVLVQPLLTKLLIDGGLIAGDFDTVLLACSAMLAVAVTAALLGGLNRLQHVTLSADVLFALRLAVFQHLERLSPAFYARRPTGDLLARLDGDVAEVQRFAIDGLLASTTALIGLIGTIALMLGLSWQLSLIAFVLLPSEIAFLRLMRPRVERATRALRERSGDLSSFLIERLDAIKVIQSANAEAREASALDALQGRFRGDLVRQQMVSWLAGAVPGILAQASTALVFVYGGWLVLEGQLTLGTLIAFAAYLGRASGPIQSLLGIYVAAQRARVSLRRVVELTDERPLVALPAVPRPLPSDLRGDVHFQSVRFDHGGQEVLGGIDLRIAAGEKVALTGPSGGGKTTLIDLLLRHADPTAGRILIGGIDLRELDLAGLSASDRSGRAGHAPVPRQPLRQPALCRARNKRGRGHGGGPPGRGRAICAAPARRLCERDRHRRTDAIGRRAPAGRVGPRPPLRPPGPGSGRGHIGRRRGDRGPDHHGARRPVR